MTDLKNLAQVSGVRLVPGPKSVVEPAPGHPRRIHGGSDLDRHADALATLAGSVRRAFIQGAR